MLCLSLIKNTESNFQPSQVSILTNQSSTNVDNEILTENDVQLVVELPFQNTVSGTALPETSTMEESAPQKPTKKRSYASMSQKHVDRAIDVKILEYLSNVNNGNNKSTGSVAAMAQGVEDAFGMSVAAQLPLLDHEAKALAMSKIQMVYVRHKSHRLQVLVTVLLSLQPHHGKKMNNDIY